MLATKPTTRENTARPLSTYPATLETNARVRNASLNKTSKEKLKWIGTVLFCTAIASCLIYRYALIAQANLQVENMKQQVMDKQDEVAKMTKYKQDLERPARIIEIAKDKLGMVFVNSPTAQGGQSGDSQ
jgi:cell division protein FtsL